LHPTLLELVNSKKVIVLLGPGGVGKTTCSIGLAVYAAMQGKRVGLLSIDPAKRLASALGLHFDGTATKIPFGESFPGSVEASMLDQKAMFDRMVHRYAPSPQIAEKILQHALYKAASVHLAGSVEYMALARLKEMVENTSYDLVVLDTPPDCHALDFLSRPDVLSRFREQKVMNWLIKPFLFATKLGLGRLMNMSEKLMGGVAQVTGFKALHSFAEFLVLIQQVIDGFHTASEGVLKILRNDKTSFLLLTVPTPSGLRTGLELGLQLKDIGYSLDGLILNRTLPKAIAREIPEEFPTGGAFLSKLWQRKINERNIQTHLLDTLSKTHARSLLRIEIEEKDYAIHNVSSVWEFAKSLDHLGRHHEG
jgi:anion-transporting  ArsA/GET3 family ATPase